MTEHNIGKVDLHQHPILSSMLSSLCHAAFFCLMLILGGSSLLDLNSKAVVNPDIDYIKVDILSDFMITKNTKVIKNEDTIPAIKSSTIPIKNPRNEKAEALQAADKPGLNDATQPGNTSEEDEVKLQSYEQILAKHFIDAMPPIPEGLSNKSDIQVLLQIDKKGNIIKHFFKGVRHNKELESLLASTILKANPAPIPPKDRFTAEYAQYIIPVFIH